MFHAMVPGRDEEEAELTRMMDEWGGLVLGLCAVTLQDGHLAQDAAQETFVKAWSHRANWPNLQNRRAWLARIAVNTCRDMLRSGWFRMRKKSVPLDVMPELEQQEDEHAREIAAAVLSLPGKYREVMVLYYEQGMRIREIAEALHMPLNSVSSRLRRA